MRDESWNDRNWRRCAQSRSSMWIFVCLVSSISVMKISVLILHPCRRLFGRRTERVRVEPYVLTPALDVFLLSSCSTTAHTTSTAKTKAKLSLRTSVSLQSTIQPWSWHARSEAQPGGRTMTGRLSLLHLRPRSGPFSSRQGQATASAQDRRNRLRRRRSTGRLLPGSQPARAQPSHRPAGRSSGHLELTSDPIQPLYALRLVRRHLTA